MTRTTIILWLAVGAILGMGYWWALRFQKQREHERAGVEEALAHDWFSNYAAKHTNVHILSNRLINVPGTKVP